MQEHRTQDFKTKSPNCKIAAGNWAQRSTKSYGICKLSYQTCSGIFFEIKMLSFHLTLVSIFLCSGHVIGQQQTIGFHGSGSSAVSRCFWHILDTIGSQSKIPIHATYRSVGSEAGQRDFMGDGAQLFSAFGSSDFSLTKEDYDSLRNAGQEVVHIPVLSGAVGVFHNIPVEDAFGSRAPDVNLTSCLLARIYKGEINDWTDPQIAAINPNMNLPLQLDFNGNTRADQKFPILVAVRERGSGSTSVFTSYLNRACPEHWGEDLVGSDIEWPMRTSDKLFTTEGTAAMVSILSSVPSIIGYSDVGAAMEVGVREIALATQQGRVDFFLTAEESLGRDGVAAALDGTSFPNSGEADWSGVDFINKVNGDLYAWPMVSISYILVRKDLTGVLPGNPAAQTLMKAFFAALFDPVYTKTCERDYMFLPIKGSLKDQALASVGSLVVSPDAPVWTTEVNVKPGEGQGEYVLSTLRSNSAFLQNEDLRKRLIELQATLQDMPEEIEMVRQASQLVVQEIKESLWENYNTESLSPKAERRLDAGFILATLSFCLWFLTALVFCHQGYRLKALESRPIVPISTKKRKEPSELEGNVE